MLADLLQINFRGAELKLPVGVDMDAVSGILDTTGKQCLRIYKGTKPGISPLSEMPGFCLLRLRPNPHRIQFCIPKTLQKCSGYAIFQITYGRLTSFFFGFSFHGKRILPQNPVYICLGSLQRTHLISGLLVIRIQSFFLGQKLSIFCL